MAFAQVIPNHTDPSAFEDVFDVSQIKAVRFLTTADFPPFNFRDSTGELVGYNIDLSEAICAEIEIECTMQSWPWNQIESALSDNQGDAAIAGIMIDVAHAQTFEFSNVYMKLPGRFVAKRSAPLLNHFDPHQTQVPIGVRRGSTHAQFLSDHFANMTPILFDSDLAVLDALQSGVIDVAFGDGMRLSFWLNQKDCCSFVDGPYFDGKLFGSGMSIAVRSGENNVRRALNIALDRLGKSGRLDELYLKWFPVGFY